MKHKHAEVIKAWADGAKIQYRLWGGIGWSDTANPAWEFKYEYRIKPEPKPDIHTYLTVALGNTGNQTSIQYSADNIKFTYDGETGALKSAEVLK